MQKIIIISLYIYNILSIVNFIEDYFDQFFIFIFFGKGFFIHKNNFSKKHNMFLKLYEYQIF